MFFSLSLSLSLFFLFFLSVQQQEDRAVAASIQYSPGEKAFVSLWMISLKDDPRYGRFAWMTDSFKVHACMHVQGSKSMPSKSIVPSEFRSLLSVFGNCLLSITRHFQQCRIVHTVKNAIVSQQSFSNSGNYCFFGVPTMYTSSLPLFRVKTVSSNC